MIITLAQYLGPHSKHPAWCPLYEQNATQLLAASAALQAEMEADGVVFPINPNTTTGVSGVTFGGWRPPECPQGASNSSHKTGEGVDRYDPKGDIDRWCMAHFDRLAAHGIYIEHPSATVGWSHWTTRAPRSGNRAFYP